MAKILCPKCRGPVEIFYSHDDRPCATCCITQLKWRWWMEKGIEITKFTPTEKAYYMPWGAFQGLREVKDVAQKFEEAVKSGKATFPKIFLPLNKTEKWYLKAAQPHLQFVKI